ncbi:MAG: hypothetical protein AAFV29_20615, partial [Myxococcota bacterium]
FLGWRIVHRRVTSTGQRRRTILHPQDTRQHYARPLLEPERPSPFQKPSGVRPPAKSAWPIGW